ncbi:PaaI family thioesterase [Nocardia sp. NBC_01499]|uniref:PaaI family thioesterase n=1 Tax=Nocardia sp. NBC_01499 TaxID=2903597 RepID=UPI00386DA411
MTSVQRTTTPESWGAARSKTVTWYDPSPSAQAMATLSGLEHVQALISGQLPPVPIAALTGTQVVHAETGVAELVCTPDESMYNPIGLVHGGLVCTLLDAVIGSAVHTTLPAGVGYTSVEIKVNYLRPVRADTGELRARGWVTKPGQRIAFGEGEIRDTDGKVLATASSSCLIMNLS